MTTSTQSISYVESPSASSNSASLYQVAQAEKILEANLGTIYTSGMALTNPSSESDLQTNYATFNQGCTTCEALLTVLGDTDAASFFTTLSEQGTACLQQYQIWVEDPLNGQDGEYCPLVYTDEMVSNTGEVQSGYVTAYDIAIGDTGDGSDGPIEIIVDPGYQPGGSGLGKDESTSTCSGWKWQANSGKSNYQVVYVTTDQSAYNSFIDSMNEIKTVAS